MTKTLDQLGSIGALEDNDLLLARDTSTGDDTRINFSDVRASSLKPVLLSVGGAADYTLSAAEASYGMLVLQGALTDNINLIVPDDQKLYLVYNNTSGSFTVTVKTSGGTGVLVGQGASLFVRSDGTNVVEGVDYADKTSTTAQDFAAMPSVSGDPIVESGSNADGEWTRWADGTQLLNISGELDGTTSNTFALPVDFIDSDYKISGSIASTTDTPVVLKYNVGGTTASQVGLLGAFYNGSFGYSTGNFRSILSGRWK